jgi:hypothetical protein
MSNEEQLMEMEALESLFAAELEKISGTEFKLNLVPFPDNSETNHVSTMVRFNFPPSYPVESSIEFSVVKTTGCIATDSSRLEDLEGTIRSVCEENMGFCCVYQIAERVQEWLRENNSEEKSLHDLLLEQPPRKPKKAIIDTDSDYNEDEDSDWDDSDYGSQDDDSEDGDEEETQYEELQHKILCPEDQRVSKTEFLSWKVQEYDPYLLKTGLIKRIAEGDNRQTGKQQFLATLLARKEKGSSDLEFDKELFGDEDDVDLDEEIDS